MYLDTTIGTASIDAPIELVKKKTLVAHPNLNDSSTTDESKISAKNESSKKTLSVINETAFEAETSSRGPISLSKIENWSPIFADPCDIWARDMMASPSALKATIECEMSNKIGELDSDSHSDTDDGGKDEKSNTIPYDQMKHLSPELWEKHRNVFARSVLGIKFTPEGDEQWEKMFPSYGNKRVPCLEIRDKNSFDEWIERFLEF